MRNLLLCLIGLFISFDTWAQAGLDNEKLRQYIDFRFDKERYSGITQIYQGDQLVFESIKGLANRSWNIPNQADTRFGLASVTKMFTAVAIGRLIDRGMVQSDAPLLTYLPEFPNKEMARTTTISDLLSHRSGISDFFFEETYLNTDRSRLRRLKDYDQFFQLLTKNSSNDHPFSYSNTNYILLGRVIEELTGQDFYSYLQAEIFNAIGMTQTGFFETDRVIPRLAEGYFKDTQASAEFGVPNDGELRKNNLLRPVKGMPAGGAFATAFDMYLFISALKKGLLSNNLFQKMIAPTVAGYGWGFQSFFQNDIKVWGHSGGFYGVSTMVFYLPKTDHTFICLTNSDFAAQPVFDRFINLLSGNQVSIPIEMEGESLKTLEGIFQVEEGEMMGRQISIQAKADHLLFDKALQFYPTGKDEFFDIDNDLFSLRFDRDARGDIVGFYRTDKRRFKQKARKITAEEVIVLKGITLDDAVLNEYLGNYQFGNEGMMPGHQPKLSINKGGLLIDNMMRFLPYEKDKFFMADDYGMRLEFQRNGTGDITGIHVLREKEVVGKVKRLK